MAVADDCIPQLFVCAIRVGKLDADGAPTAGAGNVYTSDALAKATITPVYEEGTEVKETNGCGAAFINVLGNPSFVRADIELDFLSPDPYLHAILLSQGALLTAGGGGVGFAYPPVGQVTGNGVSIELFAQRMDAGSLSQVHPYALWALPKVQSLRLGARDFTNAAQHSIITGQANENTNWFDGPANEFDAASDRVAQWIPVDALPTITCGPTATVAS